MNSAKINQKWQQNFIKLYGYSFFQMFLVAIPVIVPYWQGLGLSIKEVFLLQGVFGATLIVFDVPAGYFADLFGRKKSLVIGSLISAFGFQLLWLGQNFFDFVIYEVILGIGLSLQSGCDVALLYDGLEALNLADKKAVFLGRRVLAMQIGEGIASLLGGFFATISLKLPMILNGITPFATVLFAALLFDGGEKKLQRNSHLENFRYIKRALFGHSRLLSLLIVAYVFYSFATYCAVWALQPYWKQQGFTLTMFGVLWAMNSFLVGVVGHWAHQIEHRLGSAGSVIVIALAPILGYLGMGTFGGWIGVAFMIFFPLCRGLNMVLFQDGVNTRVPAEIRATTNSIGSLGTRMLFLVFGPLLGLVIDEKGPSLALETMGFVYIAVFIFVTIPLLRERQHFVKS